MNWKGASGRYLVADLLGTAVFTAIAVYVGVSRIILGVVVAAIVGLLVLVIWGRR